jgi:predicted hotdog family 3-hydroxylacyl-ACP dehydratase
MQRTLAANSAGREGFRLFEEGDGRRFRVEVPRESPLFAGHFPGHPILPGIAHLAIAERALGVPLGAVRALKLRRPVVPGDVLDLLLDPPGGEEWTRFELSRQGEAVSSGSVAPGRGGMEGGATRPGDIEAGDFPSAEALLPHAPPARLVRSIAEASSAEIVCVAEIPPLHPLAEEGRLPALLGIEAAAQAAAVLEALNRRREDPGPRIGYLVGVREARFAVPFLPAGQPLRATARLAGGAFPLSLYEIGVGEPGCEVVTGSISTFLAGPTPGG